MIKKYLIRLDDACPTMDWGKWRRMERILDKYKVKPMVGIIPENNDPSQRIYKPDCIFWVTVKTWERKGWTIALHGYDHCFISDKGLMGLNPIWARSEFAGISLEEQREKIRKGIEKFRSEGVLPQYFFAPAHTFDKNTLKALKEESDIRKISDTIALKPYKKDGFIFIPQVGGHCSEKRIPGLWTFCLHPSKMDDIDFCKTESFLKLHKNDMIGFDNIDFSNLSRKDFKSKIFSLVYFFRRKIKNRL